MMVPTSITISYPDTAALDSKRLADSSTVFVFTSNCMDYGFPPQASSSRQRLQARRSSPALQQSPPPSRGTPQPYSSPLPQTQWSDVPLPYRPRDWSEPEDELYEQSNANPSSAWYLRPPTSHGDLRHAQQPTTFKGRRRPRGIRELFSRGQDEPQEPPNDVSLLYPQMNPYGDRTSMHSAPDELEHYHARSISQPGTRGYMVPPSRSNESAPTNMTSMPRSPTYPPAGRGRMYSSTGVGDAAFDDEEFRLFAQATAGLGPEQAFRHPHPVSTSNPPRRRPEHESTPLNRSVTTGDIVSPLAETPTTMRALQQLPQMPEGAQQARHDRIQTSTSGLDVWLQTPGAAAPDNSDISPIEDYDDELPDYAESQAQAQAHQRAEAARRAQELQRRWQLSGGRRGI